MNQLDVLIVSAPAREGVYGKLSEFAAIEIPVWAGLIAAYLERQGYAVELLDAEVEQLTARATAAYINEAAPRLAVFPVYGQQPSASTQCMPAAEAVARGVDPSIPTLCLGTHPSALPERTLREGPWTFVVQGEGPHTIVKMLENLRREMPAHGSIFTNDFQWPMGLISKSGGYSRFGRAPNIADLDAELGDRGFRFFGDLNRYRAHDWHAFGYSTRSPYASLQTSLGCPFKCLSGDTPINTIYGDIPIRDLATRYGDKGVPVYTYDPETHRAFISDAINIRKYGEGEALVRVHFDDGTHIDCTPGHHFLQFKWGNGGSPGKQWECEAKDLPQGAHVRALRLKKGAFGYIYVAWGRRRRRRLRSRMVMDYVKGRTLTSIEQVHHRDHDKSNDQPNNLEYCTSATEHHVHHPEIAERMRINNPTRNGMDAEWRARLSTANRGKVRSQDAIKNYRRAASRRSQNANYIIKLKQSASARAERERGWTWWTAPDGKSYRAPMPRNETDLPGRVGFNPHKPNRSVKTHEVNHIVTHVEKLTECADVYCLTVPATGWFFANNVLVKNCSFCAINAPFTVNGSPPGLRCWSPGNVLAAFGALADQGVVHVKIPDEMFLLNKKHVAAICDGLIERHPGQFNIWAYARVDTLRDELLLAKMKRAGFNWLGVGI